MPSPTYSPGTLGNVLNGASLAAGKNAAALVDLIGNIGAGLDCQFTTGATAITAPVTFACYRAKATTAAGNTTISGTVTAGSTSASVASAAGIGKGQLVALIAASTGVGEIVTVSSVAGTTLTLAAGTTNAYAASDKVFLVEQAPSGGSAAPGTSWAANTTYGTSIYPPSDFVWVLQAKNTDSGQAVTISATLDKQPAFQ